MTEAALREFAAEVRGECDDAAQMATVRRPHCRPICASSARNSDSGGSIRAH
jgi:hypothetical protein